jgi:hypothetical protein
MRKDQHLEYSSFLNNVVKDSSVMRCYIVLIGKQLQMFGAIVVSLSLRVKQSKKYSQFALTNVRPIYVQD